ncbi:Synaptotagmin-like protein 4 [Eumeta japonica]|uniref:Synaptotagmin-like protein 4 n=1 Tax=Eumeta variegata TaxID=151549 RepID=A0A4C1UNS3_EUMVA|nr:Synaptotagmin-like protein 4 [Eumeta japonica]
MVWVDDMSHSPLPHARGTYSLRANALILSLPVRSDSMASVYSGAGEGARGSVTVRGEVQFSLLYNYRLGALEVGVKRCRDLAPVDMKRSRSDPYVKVYLLPDKSKAGKRKTKVKKNTLHPEFEETLRFVQPLPSLSSRTLWLSVWHADMFGRNDFLGEVTLPLADVVFDDATPMWYKLQERTEQFEEPPGSRGDLVIALKFEIQEGSNSTPSRGKGTLHVLVKEAKNLVATKPNGFDLFCKSYLLPERGRLAKQKTSVCRRTLNPRWEHTFVYRGVTLAELNTRALELSLWDRDRLASNDFMGAVRLSLGSGMYMGASVNWMDSIGKEVTLWQTMMQRPNFWVEGSLPLRLNFSKASLEPLLQDRGIILALLTTTGETWLHHYDLETKSQSMTWRRPSSPTLNKIKASRLVRKIMGSLFWDSKGQQRLTCELKLKAAIRDAGFEILEHPPYSLDLAAMVNSQKLKTFYTGCFEDAPSSPTPKNDAAVMDKSPMEFFNGKQQTFEILLLVPPTMDRVLIHPANDAAMSVSS